MSISRTAIAEGAVRRPLLSRFTPKAAQRAQASSPRRERKSPREGAARLPHGSRRGLFSSALRALIRSIPRSPLFKSHTRRLPAPQEEPGATMTLSVGWRVKMKILHSVKLLGLTALAAALLGAWAVPAQNPGDPIERGFQNPPNSAKPRVWWHWMNGNITKEGIKLDLEWMKRVGIGGFQNFDAALNTPQVVEKRLVYMTPEWKDAFKYTVTLADQLGLEMAIAGSPGWSESGGPWVPPAQAMKKFVWSETRVQGGQPFTGTLPKPPSTTGQFQNIPAGGRGGAAATAPPPQFYADTSVVSYRVPDGDIPMAESQPKVTSSGGQFSLAALTDGDLATATLLPAAPVEQKAWIQFEFAAPQTVRGLTLATGGGGRGGRGGGGPSGPELESSNDGQNFQTAVAIPAGARTIAFPAVTAKFFRVSFRTRSEER